MFTGRSTADIVVILLTLTVCLALLLTGLGITLIQLLDVTPTGAVTPAAEFLKDSLGLILGAVLGLLAGRRGGDQPTPRSGPEAGSTTREEPPR